VSELEILLGSVACRIQARAPAQPIVAVKAAAEPRPSIPHHVSGMFLRRRSEGLSPVVAAAKASRVACGSHCAW
jgi:hypothetical protein